MKDKHDKTLKYSGYILIGMTIVAIIIVSYLVYNFKK